MQISSGILKMTTIKKWPHIQQCCHSIK